MEMIKWNERKKTCGVKGASVTTGVREQLSRCARLLSDYGGEYEHGDECFVTCRLSGLVFRCLTDKHTKKNRECFSENITSVDSDEFILYSTPQGDDIITGLMSFTDWMNMLNRIRPRLNRGSAHRKRGISKCFRHYWSSPSALETFRPNHMKPKLTNHSCCGLHVTSCGSVPSIFRNKLSAANEQRLNISFENINWQT